MQPENIEVEFTLTPADVRTFGWHHLRSQWLPLLSWIVAAMAIVFLFNLFQEPIFLWLLEHDVSDDIANAALSWAPMIALWGAIIVFVIWRQRNAVKSKAVIYLHQHMTASASGLLVVRDGLLVDIAWKVVRKIKLRRKYTYIYIDARQAFVVPARAFTDAADFSRFNEIVQSYVKAARPEAA